MEAGKPQPAKPCWSGAAGYVGSVVGQLAKLQGASSVPAAPTSARLTRDCG
jgi:NADPH-dependent curcumin reductase CurA